MNTSINLYIPVYVHCFQTYTPVPWNRVFEENIGFVQTILHPYDISDFKEAEVMLHNPYVDNFPVKIII